MNRTRGALEKVIKSVLIASVLFAASAISARAQNPADVQQLRDKIKQLEQTIDDLKKQVTAVEDAQKKVPAVVPAAVPGVVPSAQPGAPSDEDKGERTFEIYGFAMLDLGYDFKTNNPDWYDVMRPTQLPSFAGQYAPDGKVYMGVRQSRLGFKSSTPTKYGDLKTTFEFELFGTGANAGQTTFRLRHAYGELGKIGAGQYWTVFGDTDAYPNSFEYWGPNGLVWFRNVQVRFMPFKGKNSWTIALEKPGASGDQGVYANRIELQGIKPKLAWPDLTSNVRFDRDWGHVQISGLVRSIRWVDTNNDAFDLGGSAVGLGANFSSHLNFGKNNVGRFQFTYGKGIENYMNDAPVDIGVEDNTAAGDPRRPLKGVALPVFGMSTFLDHTWNERFTSSVGFSMLNIENSNGQARDAYHRGYYALGNLLWTPVQNLMIGAEFQYGRRENFLDGFGVNDYRMQFAFKYNFSKAWKY